MRRHGTALVLSIALLATVAVGIVRIATHGSGRLVTPPTSSIAAGAGLNSPGPPPTYKPESPARHRHELFLLKITQRCGHPSLHQLHAILALDHKKTSDARFVTAGRVVLALERARLKRIGHITPPAPDARTFHAYVANVRFLSHALSIEVNAVDNRLHGRPTGLSPSRAGQLEDRLQSTQSVVLAYSTHNNISRCWL